MKRFRFAARLILVVIIFDLIVSGYWYRSYGQADVVDLKALPKQGAVVFHGNFNRDLTDIGPESLRRVDAAAKLFHRGLIKEIICSGGARVESKIYGSQYMKNHLMALGVPADQIHTDIESNDSRTNWQIALRIIRSRQWDHVVIVSSGLHIHRMKQQIFHQPSDDLLLSFYPYPAASTHPKITPFEAWRQVHYEWCAYALKAFFPEAVYYKIVHWLRH